MLVLGLGLGTQVLVNNTASQLLCLSVMQWCVCIFVPDCGIINALNRKNSAFQLFLLSWILLFLSVCLTGLLVDFFIDFLEG